MLFRSHIAILAYLALSFKWFYYIFEFFRDARNWLSCENKTKDMLYNCIETEDNPLISFTERDGEWVVQSPWQKYECDISFVRQELETAILDLERSVNEQLSQ